MNHVQTKHAPHGNGKPRFTPTRWKDLPAVGISSALPERLRTWTVLHDLAAEAHSARLADSVLSWESFRELVSAAASGLPVEILWEASKPAPWTKGLETTADVCIVSQFLGYSAGTTANLYVRRWGFSHPLALSNIRSVTAPKAVYGFEPTEEES